MGNVEIFIASLLAKMGELLPIIAVKILWIILFFIISKYFIKIIRKYSKIIFERNNADPLVKSFLCSLINGVTYILLFLLLINGLGIKATSLVAVLGAAGLAVGLALQGSLSNLAGGMLILMFKPFFKGHFIEFNGLSGTVDDIKMLYTTLITPDNKKVVVPNSQLSNSALINYSGNNEKKVDLTVQVSYETDIELVKKTLMEIVNKHTKIIKKEDTLIRLFKRNNSSLDFLFRAWVKTENYWDVYFDLQEEIVEVFREKGIEIPYNKLDVYTTKVK